MESIKDPILQIKDVSIAYGSNKLAVKHVTADVAKNTITAIMGPSGCGKSTLLRAVNRMHELYKAILLGNLGINEGMLTENVVAQLLVSNGCRLFYYRRGRNDPKGQMEVDFLIRRGLKICPVEVKSSDDSTHHPSLDSFRKIFRKGMGPSYVLHPKDVSRKDGIIYLPLYMAQFL